MTKKTFVFGLVLLMSFSAFAMDALPVGSSLEMYAAGKINKCPVYQLRFVCDKNTSYQIIIKDEFGSVLYEESVRGTDIIRNYMIDVSELGNTPVSFEVFNSAGMMLKKFSTDPSR